MMNTHQNQLRIDEERIDKECPGVIPEQYLERSGRYSALAHYYAVVADYEAAQRQRQVRDPKALMAAFVGQVGGPTAADIHALLADLFEYLHSVRPELSEVAYYIEYAEHECAFAAEKEDEKRRDEEDISRTGCAP